MQILLDECVPQPLKCELRDYEIRTVEEMGWSGQKNNELLELMLSKSFTVLLTIDRTLQYESNVQQTGVAVIIMITPNNRLSEFVPLIADVRNVLNTLAPGKIVEVGGF